MKALVTGAGGFIGSHVVEKLCARNHEVRALVHYNSAGSIGWLSDLPKEILGDIEIVSGDVRDPRRMREIMRDCDAVFHLAALIAIPYSYMATSSYIETNVGGTLNILEAAREQPNGCRMVCISTSEIYGTAKFLPITEEHPINAQSPYAASKIAADQLALACYRSFGQPVVVVRPFNTFGPRQSTRAVVPTILTQLLSDDGTVHLGALAPTRDLTYVTDTASGIIDVGMSDVALGRVVQLGTGREISIGDLAALCAETIGVELKIEEDAERIRPMNSEVMRLLSNPAFALEYCGWQVEVPLEDGIAKTADWLRDHLDLYRPQEYGL